MNRIRLGLMVIVLGALLSACGRSEERPSASTPSVATSETPAATATATVTASAAPSATPTAEAIRQDLRATRLTIPSLGIDVDVQRSEVIPDTTQPGPGCPATPASQQTLTVPSQGIATPEMGFDGLENKAWIFGHSRWQGEPGVFFALQDINIGDELFVDGVDRQTGEVITDQRYIVDALYLSDRTSGGALITAATPEDIPLRPTVILQTSVRETGPDRPWILDEATLRAKATNAIEGDLDDPCNYLLLFVMATAG